MRVPLIGVLAVLTLSAFATGLALAQADDTLPDAAIALMTSQPDRAEALLEQSSTMVGRLDHMLFLLAFREPGPARDAKIAALQTAIDNAADLELDGSDRSLFGPPTPFDGTDESLFRTLTAASSSGIAATGPMFYAIPCPILQRRPALLAATAPQFGSNRDNFLPRSGCAWGRGEVEGFPEQAVARFVEVAEQADGHFLATYEGSARFAYQSEQAMAIERTKLDPAGFLTEPPPRQSIPYETWSYLAVANHRRFAPIRRAFEEAHAALSTFYAAAGLSEDEGSRAARRALFSAVWGADCGGAPPPASLRTLVLDGASQAELQALIDSGNWRDGALLAPFEVCAADAGRDPLIHLAVTRPELLDRLSALADTVPADRRAALDLDMSPGARNGFGKTALMSAAQWNSLDSVDWLLARGAAVDDVTDDAGDWDRPRHGRRTALMYAAASAGLPVIRRLLAAGADPGLRDGTGLRALDYLTGRGPVPANTLLSAAERAEAEGLLR